jgi:hypothetical protein
MLRGPEYDVTGKYSCICVGVIRSHLRFTSLLTEWY